MVPMLIAVANVLRLADGGEGTLLLVRYPEGDCDTIPWPFGHCGDRDRVLSPTELSEKIAKDRMNLAKALYDKFECGDLSERTVALPDGTAFNIDNNLA